MQERKLEKYKLYAEKGECAKIDRKKGTGVREWGRIRMPIRKYMRL